MRSILAGRLEKIVSQFEASSLGRVETDPDEEIPVEIEYQSLKKWNKQIEIDYDKAIKLIHKEQFTEQEPAATGVEKYIQITN